MNSRTLYLFVLLLGSSACSRRTEEKATEAKSPRVENSAAIASATVASKGESPREPAKPLRGILVVSIDSLRADMPWAGYPRPIAPRLTKFAEGAIQYTHAYSISSYTSMSLGGFLGGRYPSEMKRDGYFFGGYAPENIFFTELLQEKGVYTTSVQAHGYFKGGGFQQGFDAWQVVPGINFNNLTDENMTGEQHEALAEKALDAVGERRFFAWFHFMDPHDKYLPHPGISYGRTARDLYDAEVTYTDTQVGKLLDFVAGKPWANEIAIFVTADHGEGFGEHGKFFHGFELWEELVHVPLLVKLPGSKPRVIATARSAVDLAPTFLELMGAEKGEGMRGVSLVPELRGGEAEERDVILDLPTTSDNAERRAVISHGIKAIKFAGGGTRAFDLENDPGEKTPLTGVPRDGAIESMKRADQRIEFVPTTKCKEGCLNGTYAKDGGAP